MDIEQLIQDCLLTSLMLEDPEMFETFRHKIPEIYRRTEQMKEFLCIETETK